MKVFISVDMVQGLDSSHDAAMFVGYHSCAGTEGGVLNHTPLGKEVQNLVVAGHERDRHAELARDQRVQPRLADQLAVEQQAMPVIVAQLLLALQVGQQKIYS
jgi:D-aminopeptidase